MNRFENTKKVLDRVDNAPLQYHCRKNMQEYLEFLQWHHGYSNKRIRETFPEYVS